MTNSSKAKGDNAEREVQALLRHHLGIPTIRRSLGAGRKDDVGDIDKVPNTVIQVAAYANLAKAINEKVPKAEEQRLNKRVRFASTFLRRRGGSYVVVQSPEQWARMWKYAQIGLKASASTRAKNNGKMPIHAPRRRKSGTGR